jgi:hypothetical protein
MFIPRNLFFDGTPAPLYHIFFLGKSGKACDFFRLAVKSLAISRFFHYNDERKIMIGESLDLSVLPWKGGFHDTIGRDAAGE